MIVLGFNLQREDISSMCISTQVWRWWGCSSKERVQKLKNKDLPSRPSIVPLSQWKPSIISFSPQLDEPAVSLQDLFFLLPEKHLKVVFLNLFPLRLLMYNVLNAMKSVPFWTLLKFFSLWVKECKLGIMLADPSEVDYNKMRSLEVRVFSTKTCDSLKRPHVMIN